MYHRGKRHWPARVCRVISESRALDANEPLRSARTRNMLNDLINWKLEILKLKYVSFLLCISLIRCADLIPGNLPSGVGDALTQSFVSSVSDTVWSKTLVFSNIRFKTNLQEFVNSGFKSKLSYLIRSLERGTGEADNSSNWDNRTTLVNFFPRYPL